MNRLLYIVTGCFLLSGCAVMVNSPEERKSPVVQTVITKTKAYFPFENNTNWWSFTETSGNKLDIKVTDTISDDNIMYYRVSFQEHRVDTTDDWFKRIRGDILFGSSLTGSYSTFLPSQLDSVNGSFLCGSNRIKYSFKDSATINGVTFKKILILKYSTAVIHGFEEITMAESIGIVQMRDYNGRWPIDYTVDSCRIDTTIRRF